MLLEAIELIQETARRAASPEVMTISGDPSQVLISHDGKLEKHILPAKDRQHIVNTLEDLAKAAHTWKGGGTVWHDHSGIVLVTDDEMRRDRVTMPLKTSGVFDTLKKLEAGCPLDQKGFIRLLRVELAGAVESPNLLPNIRALKFRRSTSGQSDVQHGKESLGREIEAEISGTDLIPEEIGVDCDVYTAADVTYMATIRCALFIEPSEERFILKPLPDQLEDAIQECQMEAIRKTLIDSLPAGTPVFYGKP